METEEPAPAVPPLTAAVPLPAVVTTSPAKTGDNVEARRIRHSMCARPRMYRRNSHTPSR